MSTPRLSRRTLLKAGAIAGASLSVPWRWLASPAAARGFQSSNLRKFIQPLRGVGGPTGIPVAQPDSVNPGWWQPGVTHYTIDIAQFADRLHPDLKTSTKLRGFGQGDPTKFKHLGGIIAAKRGSPVQITFRNKLPMKHILPVDRTIMGAEGQDNRTAVHLHGGFVPWTSDGIPHAWWDPNGHKGESFVNNAVLRPGQLVPSNEAEYYYPNNQGSRLIWYHDHALGITRLNAYAGIASGYVIYDDYELGLVATAHLPGPLDQRTAYLIFQDKVFVPGNVATTDPTWSKIMKNSNPGDLWYAHVYDADIGPHPAGDPLDLPVSVVPEFFGDTILVNGTVYPFLEVEPRQYRFRLLNACNSRFLNPRLVYAAGSTFPNNTEPGSVPGPAFVQFQSEGGFLPAPVYLDGSPTSRLLLAPAERADLIVDFRDVPGGSRLILVNDALSPYPSGDPIIFSQPGSGPDTRTLLQIRVKARVGAADPQVSLPLAALGNPGDPFIVTQVPGQPTPVPTGVGTRRLTLNEAFDDYGRLIQLLGPAAPGGLAYEDDPTEIVHAGSTEVWEIFNLSEDTHPIHFHLVNVQVLSREAFSWPEGDADPTLTGNPFAPDDNELGWKETVRMNGGEVTRVIMRFDLPTVPFTVPASPRLRDIYGIEGGAEYVWHCHILEHEEHDMMRPLVVV